MRGPASASTIRAKRGSMVRKFDTSARFASSAMAPTSSTPVAPPPTTTKFNSRRRSSGSDSISALSKASRIRRRRAIASSIPFRNHLVLIAVDRGNIAEHDVYIGSTVKLGSDRRCDVGRRQCRRGDLVQQRLEQVIIVAIDQSDIERPSGQ